MHSLIHRFAQQKFANLDEETRSRLQKRHTDSFNTLGEDIAQSVMLGHNERKRMSIVFDDIVQAIETSLQWGEFSVALRLCDNMFTAASEVSMAGLESILKQLWGFAEKNDLLRRVEVRSTLKLRHATLLSYKYQWVDTLNLAEEVARDDPLDGMTEEESRRLHAIRAEAAMLAVIANAMSKDEHSPLDVLIEYSIKKASGIQPARKPVGLTDKQVEIYLEDAEAWIPYAGNILGNEDILTVYLLRAKAMWAFEQKKFRKSLGCFSEAVRKAKSAKHVLLAQLCSLGQVDALIELKRINEAVKLLQALLEGGFALEHPYYEAKLKLVNCFLQQGKQAAAVKILRTIDTALDGWDELKAQRALALSILGGILCSNGDVEEGIEKLLEAGNLWKALPGSENQQKRIADWLSYHTKHGL
ncbi:hypothetical protein D6779_00995 [Candidatus Parcubacteria bacterium]|nr:MAG: hypothetical protein D6779_00995 [Candidatus Parcubacteria bacterium]